VESRSVVHVKFTQEALKEITFQSTKDNNDTK
jgi:hypothetical protein